MKYLFCEIKSDDTVSVIRTGVTEQEVKEFCSWSDKYVNRNLVLFPYKSVSVTEKNFGNDIDVKIE